MTVLFITSKSLGGSGKYISCLAAGVQDKVNCELLYFPSGAVQDGEIECAFKAVHHFPSRPSFNPVAVFKDVMFVRKVLRQGRYSAVHTHTSFGGLIGRLGAFLSGRDMKIIHTLHAFGADEFTPYPQKWLYWLIEKGLDAMTDRYIAPSRYTREYGTRTRLINPAKATVIYNALPLKASLPIGDAERQRVRASFGAGPDDIVFLFCGRFEKQKGVDILLQAVALVKVAASFKVVLCGTGELEDALRSLAIDLGIQDHMVWLGWQQDLRGFYEAADVYVMPSRWETFGLVFLEAMNYSLPILSTRTQAIPEVVENNVSGLLSINEDARGLAKNMEKLIMHAELRHQLGMQGHQRLHARFSYEKFIHSHLALYEECMPIAREAQTRPNPALPLNERTGL
jgi:glycosyltransferase involved in cell wall biosynthesis